jgi:hypothetical protein
MIVPQLRVRLCIRNQTHLGPGSSTTKNRIGSITAEDCVSIVEMTEETRARYQTSIRKFRA